MRHKGTDSPIGAEAGLLLDLLRDIRDELRYLRQEMRAAAHGPAVRGGPEPDELLTVGQVADELQVVPGTVRSWILSGALRASRPGRGGEPGRTYRVHRGDLTTFVEAMRCRVTPLEVDPRKRAGADPGYDDSSPPTVT